VLKRDKNLEKPVIFLVLVDSLTIIVLVGEFIYFTVYAYQEYDHNGKDNK